jgi:outer membrane protein
MNTIKSLLLIASFVSISMSSIAQKFGYIDSQQLLLALPNIKQADTQIKTFSDQMMAKGKKMVEAFEVNYNNYVKEVQSETLSPLQMQEKEAALGQEQESIRKYELEIQQKVAQERERLYNPILEQVKTTIEAIGKEESYTMIFDVSTGMLVYAEPDQDLMAKVKARLGI